MIGLSNHLKFLKRTVMSKLPALVITGGMGTGKSTVLKYFKENGFLVYDADALVTELFQKSNPYYQEVAQAFDIWLGTDFTQRDGIDKKYLRPFLENIADGFPKSLQLVTPFIQKAIEDTFHSCQQPVIFEIPLLFEANMENNFEKILLITCNMDKRLERIQIRQAHLTLEKIQQTINSQKTDEEKKPFVDFIIDNSTTVKDLTAQLDLLSPEIQKYYSSFNKNKFKKAL